LAVSDDFKGHAEFMVVKSEKANYVPHTLGSGQDDELRSGFPYPARTGVPEHLMQNRRRVNRW
jgi:hypothetical protein